MTINKTAAVFGLAAMTMLAGCAGGVTTAPETPQPPAPAVDVLAQYEIPGFSVTEFRAEGNDGTICVAVDGYQAAGISCWKAEQAAPGGSAEVIATYSIREGDVVQFRPASDSSHTCFTLDSYKAGTLTCIPG